MGCFGHHVAIGQSVRGVLPVNGLCVGVIRFWFLVHFLLLISVPVTVCLVVQPSSCWALRLCVVNRATVCLLAASPWQGFPLLLGRCSRSKSCSRDSKMDVLHPDQLV